MQAGTELLSSKLPPDEFSCVSDYCAQVALYAPIALDLRVPEDVGMVDFSNDTFTSLFIPRLSSVDQNCKKVGSDTVRIYFDDKLEKPSDGKHKKKLLRAHLSSEDHRGEGDDPRNISTFHKLLY